MVFIFVCVSNCQKTRYYYVWVRSTDLDRSAIVYLESHTVPCVGSHKRTASIKDPVIKTPQRTEVIMHGGVIMPPPKIDPHRENPTL
jgi:hypothetical protein